MSLDYWFEKLSYSNYTTCIRSDNLDLIEQALIRILEQEGCRRILKPPLPANPLPVMKTLLSLPWEIEPYLWVLSLFPSNLGWTVVKASPIDLLCRRTRDAIRHRLSELAMQTGCDAFYCGMCRYSGVLLEADASGQTFASGYLDCDDIENMKFYDEPINEPGKLRFSLLNVPEELQAAGRVHKSVSDEERRTREEELEALFQQGGKQADIAWAGWKKLHMSYFERADEALGQVLTNSSDYWYFDNLLYTAYAEPQQLETDGARLLYFQPAESHLNFETGEIWSVVSNATAMYTESEIDDIPFMRPVYSRTPWAYQLCDSWELEANRPWEGVKQFKL